MGGQFCEVKKWVVSFVKIVLKVVSKLKEPTYVALSIKRMLSDYLMHQAQHKIPLSITMDWGCLAELKISASCLK